MRIDNYTPYFIETDFLGIVASMRIALFSSTLDSRNGYGNITFEYCRTLQEKGIDFVLFLPRNEQALVDSLHLTYEVRCILPPYIFECRNPHFLRYFFAPNLVGFSIVHSLLDFPYCFVAARAAKKYRLPFMMGSQGTYGVVPLLRFPDRMVLEWCYGQAKEIIVPSVFTRDLILKHTRKSYDIRIIHNGVRFERFNRTVPPSPLRVQHAGKTILLTVGGLKERKGQDLVLRAIAKLGTRAANILYVLVGTGEYQSYLQELATELGVADKILFAGSQTGDELVSTFYACDLYVHTPKVVHYNFEGFGIVYLEAGACAKPSIATDAGGVRDAVVDGKTGIIVPDGNIDAIADVIDRLVSNPVLARQMGEAGRLYAKEHDWSSIVDAFVSLYTQHVRT